MPQEAEKEDAGSMRAPVRAPHRRRGPGLSDVAVGGGIEPLPPSAELCENSTEHGEDDVVAGSDGGLDSRGQVDKSDVDNDSGEHFDGLEVDNDNAEVSDGGKSDFDDISVTVDAPATWHTDWNAWQAYFTQYCNRTMQVLTVKETMSRAERNRRLMKAKKGVSSSQLVPEECDPYMRTYICTHGWKKRKSRSEGSRPRQHIRLTDCPFRFVVQWDITKGEFQVKNGTFTHNHAVSPAAFATYPTSRGLKDPVVSARVDGMLAVGAKRSRIYDYLLEQDQNVIQVDVDNLVRQHASSISNEDDNEATAREIAFFPAADSENVSTVAETKVVHRDGFVVV